ncbi:hypothetical protein [Geodermatophilus sp. TF02-6]|uniref:hypothetical protein n=1 Tax=Geodermatophilus sp. TF02-6 TaxID=2250575 RepID=UPI0011BE7A91|nr:hypothetical protein [Geodermatophilus sp. TF02-6]
MVGKGCQGPTPQPLDPVSEHRRRPLPAADLRQIAEQDHCRVVVSTRTPLDQLEDFLPCPLLPPRELGQVVLVSAFGGATPLRVPPRGLLPSRTLPILAAPPGLRGQLFRRPAADVAGT